MTKALTIQEQNSNKKRNTISRIYRILKKYDNKEPYITNVILRVKQEITDLESKIGETL